MDQKNYKKLANFVMKLPQYLYDEYRENINGVFLFFDEFQIIKELEDELTDFLWHMRSFIQKQNNVSYIFSGSMSVKDSLIEEIAGSNGHLEEEYLQLRLNHFLMKLLVKKIFFKNCYNLNTHTKRQFLV